MTDTRIQKLAHLLVHYSLEVKPGQLVKITGERVTLPLLIAAAEEVIKAGGQPYIDTIIPEFIEAMLKFGNDKQLSFVSPLAKLEAEKMDCFLVVWGGSEYEVSRRYRSETSGPSPESTWPDCETNISASWKERAQLGRDTVSHPCSGSGCRYVTSHLRRLCLWRRTYHFG